MPPKTAEMTPAERAQRDADKVFHWIRLSGDKVVVKPAPAAASVAPKPVTRSVAAVPLSKPPAEPVAAAAAAVAAVAPPAAAPPPTLLAVAAPTMAEQPSPLPAASPAPELLPLSLPLSAPLPELPLKLVNRVEPEIPRQLIGGLRSGSVLVSFVVLPDGSVQQAEVKQPGNRKLAAVAIKAVSQWRFEPIAKAREATVELGFELDQ